MPAGTVLAAAVRARVGAVAERSRPSAVADSVSVCVEVGSRRTFAGALDWPGWCRSGRGEEEALEALRAYAPRYAQVVRAAGIEPPDSGGLTVAERLPGSATTDFGAPGAIAEHDHEPLAAPEAERLVRLLQAAWECLDHVAATAPATLRKGPRGGGRDRDAIVDHVLSAETEAYARKLGLRLSPPTSWDPTARAALRGAIANALRATVQAPPGPPGSWPPRYAARRIGWHVLDHVWEIQDRSGTGTAL